MAGILQSGGQCGGQPLECYQFVETDATGHDWYQRTLTDDARRESVPVS